ncbi:hypothetical protein C8Q73DRAFT_792316 [Cubamyces lactineus]|nr:hypothetical protein C8Q73DRAFT_792316 [Cubamyces lactineus]
MSSSLHPLRPLTAEQATCWLQSVLEQCRENVNALPESILRGEESAAARRQLQQLRLLHQHAGVLNPDSGRGLWNGLCAWFSDEAIKDVAEITAAIERQAILAQDSRAVFRAIIPPEAMASMCRYLEHVHDRLEVYLRWEESREGSALRTIAHQLREEAEVSRAYFLRRNIGSKTSVAERYELPALRARPDSDAPSSASSASTTLVYSSTSPLRGEGEWYLGRTPSVSRGRRSSRGPRARTARTPDSSPSPGRSPRPCSPPPRSAKALGKRRARDDGSPARERSRKRRKPTPPRVESRSSSRDADVSASESSSSSEPLAPPLPPPSPPSRWAREGLSTPESTTAVSSSSSEGSPATELSTLSRVLSPEVSFDNETVRDGQYHYPTGSPSTIGATSRDVDVDMMSMGDDEDAASYITAEDSVEIDGDSLGPLPLPLPPPSASIPTSSPRAPARHSKFIGRRRCWDGVVQFMQYILRS